MAEPSLDFMNFSGSVAESRVARSFPRKDGASPTGSTEIGNRAPDAQGGVVLAAHQN